MHSILIEIFRDVEITELFILFAMDIIQHQIMFELQIQEPKNLLFEKHNRNIICKFLDILCKSCHYFWAVKHFWRQSLAQRDCARRELFGICNSEARLTGFEILFKLNEIINLYYLDSGLQIRNSTKQGRWGLFVI